MNRRDTVAGLAVIVLICLALAGPRWQGFPVQPISIVAMVSVCVLGPIAAAVALVVAAAATDTRNGTLQKNPVEAERAKADGPQRGSS